MHINVSLTTCFPQRQPACR